MLSQVIKAVAQSELQVVKRRATAAGFALASAFLVSLALVFAFLALFLWLMTRMEPWLAALIVVGALLVGALMIWLLGRLVARSAASRTRADPQVQAIFDEASVAMKKDGVSVTAASTALAIGFAIGRRITK